jgi:ubiquinone/menaquinone biosynthesis C-methylase UbiE
MNSAREDAAAWASSYRLVAADKWRKQSAEMGRAATEALVRFAGPEPGMCVLDLASGTGEPAISLAAEVGPGGSVAALDINPELLEIAQGRARHRKLGNISFYPGDAHRLPFADSSFDLVTCRFGVMFFDDVAQALRECHRVLRPGGRACFLAWGPFEQPYWASTMGVVLRHVGEPLFPKGGADPFRFAREGSLAEAMQRAGFNRVREEARRVPWRWPGSAEEVWQYAQAVSTPFRWLLNRVPQERWRSIHAEVIAEVSQFRRSNGIEFFADVVLASGQR